jgi:hypothetical protein
MKNKLSNDEKKRLGFIKILEGMKMVCETENRHPNQSEKNKARKIMGEIDYLDWKIILDKTAPVISHETFKPPLPIIGEPKCKSFGEFLQEVARGGKTKEYDPTKLIPTHWICV